MLPKVFFSRWMIVLLVLIFVIGVVAGLLWWQRVNVVRWLNDRLNIAQIEEQEVNNVIAEIGKVTVLPSGKPTLATVTDAERLSDQPFFAQAQNGDQVLIYTDVKKAFLYRPSTRQIVEIAPLNIENSTNTGTNVEPSVEQNLLSVVLYNGTATTGLTSRYETRLRERAPNVTVSLKQNAARSDYADSIIVDLTGTNTTQVQALSTATGIEVGTLPAGEAKPEGEVLIILGSDQAVGL